MLAPPAHAGPNTHACMQDDFKIVDKDGCHDVTDFVSHNLGTAPARTIMARKGYTDASGVADQIIIKGISAGECA